MKNKLYIPLFSLASLFFLGQEKTKNIKEVVIRKAKSTTEFRLDKRVFNVGEDLSSTGASALEVLNNVPSVNVNIEGEISLRGSTGVQILINGKPSVLANEEGNALGTITAEMIDKIEVITNPSAKYNAEGTTGIINIVLRKNKKRGLNGAITLNTGVPNNHSLGLSLNNRTEKFNLFSQFGVGYRTFPSEEWSINRNKLTDSEVNSFTNGDKNELFYNIILGTDYHINDLNTLTLSGNFAYEKENHEYNALFNQLTSNSLDNKWKRIEDTKATNPKWEYELEYQKKFADHKEHTLLLSATGNFFGKDKKSNFENNTIFGTQESSLQKANTDFKEAQYTFKADYTRPFSEKYTLETGAQYQINDVTNDYEVSNFTNGIWVSDASLTNIFNYNQKVLGVYGTFSYEGEKWGVKTGLRMENTDLKTELQTTNEKNNQNYTDFFPSVHTSYKFSKKFSLQFGYSRRIDRPRLWSLNPFFGINNNYNIRTGNPNLQPEYTNSYEISSIHKIRKASFNWSIYHHYTTDVKERVVRYENDVAITQPQNIGANSALGFELNGKYSFSKWLSFNGDFNFNYFDRKGEYENQNFDFSGQRWRSRLTAKVKLPAKIDIELSGNYRSKYKGLQTIKSTSWFMNFGARKKIMKGKGIINLSVRDIFSTRIREVESRDALDFYTYQKYQRGAFFTIGFSYGFGKGEAMEFSGQKRF